MGADRGFRRAEARHDQTGHVVSGEVAELVASPTRSHRRLWVRPAQRAEIALVREHEEAERPCAPDVEILAQRKAEGPAVRSRKDPRPQPPEPVDVAEHEPFARRLDDLLI